MNKSRFALTAAFLFFCFALCTGLPTVAAASVTPLNTLEGYFYGYWFPNARVDILMPASSSHQILLNSSNTSCAMFENEAYPGVALAFFCIENEAYEDVPLDTFDDARMYEFLYTISHNPSDTAYEILGDFYKGIPAVRVLEDQDGIHSEHLVAVKGKWVLNAMLQCYDGRNTVSQAARAWQTDVLASAMDDALERVASYTFSDLGTTLAMPDGLFLAVEQDTLYGKTLNIMEDAMGVLANKVFIEAVYQPELKHKTLDSLDAEALDALVSMGIFGLYEKSPPNIVTDFAGDAPAVTFTVSGQTQYLGLRDGWVFLVTSIPGGPGDPVRLEALRKAVTQTLLGDPQPIPLLSEIKAVRLQGTQAIIPLANQTLTLTLPAEYQIDVLDDTDNERMLLASYVEEAANDDEGGVYDYFMIYAQYLGEYMPSPDDPGHLEMTAEYAEMAYEKYADLWEGVSYNIIKDSALGLPVVHLADKAGHYTAIVFLHDGWILDIANVNANHPALGPAALEALLSLSE